MSPLLAASKSRVHKDAVADTSPAVIEHERLQNTLDRFGNHRGWPHLFFHPNLYPHSQISVSASSIINTPAFFHSNNSPSTLSSIKTTPQFGAWRQANGEIWQETHIGNGHSLGERFNDMSNGLGLSSLRSMGGF